MFYILQVYLHLVLWFCVQILWLFGELFWITLIKKKQNPKQKPKPPQNPHPEYTGNPSQFSLFLKNLLN